MIVVWTPDKLRRLREGWRAGVLLKDLTAELGLSPSSISTKARGIGLDRRNKRRGVHTITIIDKHQRYLHLAAIARRTTTRRLVRAIFNAVMDSEMIDAVMDDGVRMRK